jgi:hypothetical protein
VDNFFVFMVLKSVRTTLIRIRADPRHPPYPQFRPRITWGLTLWLRLRRAGRLCMFPNSTQLTRGRDGVLVKWWPVECLVAWSPGVWWDCENSA